MAKRYSPKRSNNTGRDCTDLRPDEEQLRLHSIRFGIEEKQLSFIPEYVSARDAVAVALIYQQAGSEPEPETMEHELYDYGCKVLEQLSGMKKFQKRAEITERARDLYGESRSRKDVEHTGPNASTAFTDGLIRAMQSSLKHPKDFEGLKVVADIGNARPSSHTTILYDYSALYLEKVGNHPRLVRTCTTYDLTAHREDGDTEESLIQSQLTSLRRRLEEKGLEVDLEQGPKFLIARPRIQ